MPICSLAAAARRSAWAMSGRRSSNCEGTPSGIFGSVKIEGRRRNAEVGQVVIGESADGVLELRASHTEVDELRADRFKLSLRLRDVYLGGDAAVKAPLREVELMLEIGDGRR